MSSPPGSSGPLGPDGQPLFPHLLPFPPPTLTAESGFNAITRALSTHVPTRIAQAKAIRQAATGQLRQAQRGR